jgi:hypothetical protein
VGAGGRSEARHLGKVGIVKMEPQPFAVSLRRVGRSTGILVFCLLAVLPISAGRAACLGGPTIVAATAPADSAGLQEQ